MKELNFRFVFGFWGGYSAEDEGNYDVSDALYEELKKIYMNTGEDELEAILHVSKGVE